MLAANPDVLLGLQLALNLLEVDVLAAPPPRGRPRAGLDRSRGAKDLNGPSGLTAQPVVKPNRKCCVNGKVESGALNLALSHTYIGCTGNADADICISVPI